jgi:hypothetical protein
VVLAPRGLREREEGGLERFDDAGERRRLIKQTFLVHLQALAAAGALTVLLILLG